LRLFGRSILRALHRQATK